MAVHPVMFMLVIGFVALVVNVVVAVLCASVSVAVLMNLCVFLFVFRENLTSQNC